MSTTSPTATSSPAHTASAAARSNPPANTDSRRNTRCSSREQQVVAPVDDAAQRLLAGLDGAAAGRQQTGSGRRSGRRCRRATATGSAPPPAPPPAAGRRAGRRSARPAPRRPLAVSRPPASARSRNRADASSGRAAAPSTGPHRATPRRSRLVASTRTSAPARSRRSTTRRRLVDHVLAVVDHQRARPCRPGTVRAGRRRPRPAPIATAAATSRGSRNGASSISQTPSGCSPGQPGRRLQGEARLAHTSRTDQRHQPVPAQQSRHRARSPRPGRRTN